MRIIFVRHGETEANKQNILQGWSDGSLTEKGMEQAGLAGKRLGRMKINHIYCSDLKRARQTASQIINYVNAPISFDPSLRELNMGEYENQRDVDYNKLLHDSGDFMRFKPEGGESLEEFQSRLQRFYEKVTKNHVGENVLVVSHGGAIANMLLILFEKDGKKFEDFSHHNTGITILNLGNKPKIKLLNCIRHLRQDQK